MPLFTEMPRPGASYVWDFSKLSTCCACERETEPKCMSLLPNAWDWVGLYLWRKYFLPPCLNIPFYYLREMLLEEKGLGYSLPSALSQGSLFISDLWRKRNNYWSLLLKRGQVLAVSPYCLIEGLSHFASLHAEGSSITQRQAPVNLQSSLIW